MSEPNQVISLEDRRRRSPNARAVHKLRVLEHCRRCVQAGELRRSATAVLQYIAELIDKETGFATARLRTIAEGTTYSRGEVGKAIKELVDRGLLERISRRRGNECLAASFRLCDPDASTRHSGRPEATGSSPRGDTSRAGFTSSPDGHNPAQHRPTRRDRWRYPSKVAATRRLLGVKDDVAHIRAKFGANLYSDNNPARQEGARDGPHAANLQDCAPVGLPIHIERALRELVGEYTYDTWLDHLTLISDMDSMPVVGVPTRFIRDWVVNHYAQALQRAFGRPVEVIVRAPPSRGLGTGAKT